MASNRRRAENYYKSSLTKIGDDTWRSEIQLLLQREGNTFKQVTTQFLPFQDNLQLQLESGVRPEISLEVKGHNLCTVVHLLSSSDRMVKYQLKISNARGWQYLTIPQQQVHLQADVQYSREYRKRVDQSLLDNKSLTISFEIQSQIDSQSTATTGRNPSPRPAQNVNQNNHNRNDWTNVAQNNEVAGDLQQHSHIHHHESTNWTLIICMAIVIIILFVAWCYVLYLIYPWIFGLAKCLMSAEALVSSAAISITITLTK